MFGLQWEKGFPCSHLGRGEQPELPKCHIQAAPTFLGTSCPTVTILPREMSSALIGSVCAIMLGAPATA